MRTLALPMNIGISTLALPMNIGISLQVLFLKCQWSHKAVYVQNKATLAGHMLSQEWAGALKLSLDKYPIS